LLEVKFISGVVTHTYNTSYLVGGMQENLFLPALAKTS
jgi:hypothetical protein